MTEWCADRVVAYGLVSEHAGRGIGGENLTCSILDILHDTHVSTACSNTDTKVSRYRRALQMRSSEVGTIFGGPDYN